MFRRSIIEPKKGEGLLRTVIIYIFEVLYLIRHAITIKQINRTYKGRPIEEKDRRVYSQARQWARQTMKLAGTKVSIKGNEKFPEGPVLMASNHQGNFDIMALLGYLEKPFGFISKIEVKNIPVVRPWMEAMHCVFIDRKNRKQALAAVQQGIHYLEEGHSLLIFPEGTRNFGKGLKPFKSGGLSMASQANVPIVPVALEGTYRVMEDNDGKVKPAKVEIQVCDPIFPEEYKDLHANEVAELVKERITEALEMMEGNVQPLPKKTFISSESREIQG